MLRNAVGEEFPGKMHYVTLERHHIIGLHILLDEFAE